MWRFLFGDLEIRLEHNMKFLTMEEQLKFYRNKRIKKQTLESYFIAAGFQYMEPAVVSPYEVGGGLVKIIDGKGEIYSMRGDMTEGIIQQLSHQELKSKELKLYYDGKVFITKENGDIETKDQMGVEWIGGNVFESVQELIRLSAQVMLHQQDEVVVEISHIAYFLGLINRYNLNSENKKRLQHLLNLKNSVDLKTYLTNSGCVQECIEDFLELMTLNGSFEMIQKKLKNKKDDMSQSVLQDLLSVEEGLKKMEDNGEVHFDLSIIPSYDYYTGIVFKGFSTTNYKELISGGQYLINTIQERKIKAVGFSLYESAML